jgi:hypothetical protein
VSYPPVGEELRSDDRVSLVMFPAVGSYARSYEHVEAAQWSNLAVSPLVGPVNLIVTYAPAWTRLSSGRAIEPDPMPTGGTSPATGGIQGWEPDALLRLAQQRSLQDNWDTYGGIAVTEEHARRAWQFLSRAMRPGLPLPSFIPLGDGGVQLEWDNGHSQLSYTTEEGSDPEIWLTTPVEDNRLDEPSFFRALSAFRR